MFVISRAANLQASLLEFKFEFNETLQVKFEFFMCDFASLISSSVVFIESMQSSNSFYRI